MFEHVEDVEAFASALQRVRRHAGLSYRQLAGRAHYSHPHLVRATNGKQLPTWEVAEAFLTGCGVPADLMPVWRRRWETASRDPRDIVGLLDNAQTLEELGAALAALAHPRSLRALAQLTGIPRATLQAWLQGARLAGPDRLDLLVRAVGATTAERAAVARAADRLGAAREHLTIERLAVERLSTGRERVRAGSERLSSGRLRPAPAG
jgi:transcriptional regulator with XRE-family HTH domain